MRERTLRRARERAEAKAGKAEDKQRARIQQYFAMLHDEMSKIPEDHEYYKQIQEGLAELRQIAAWWLLPEVTRERKS